MGNIFGAISNWGFSTNMSELRGITGNADSIEVWQRELGQQSDYYLHLLTKLDNERKNETLRFYTRIAWVVILLLVLVLIVK